MCHTSVSKGTLAAGATIKSDARIERCTKVAGDVAYTVTLGLNEFFAGTWTAPVWNPSQETDHGIRCHGPDVPTQKVRKCNQQGHMECLMCHSDHTA